MLHNDVKVQEAPNHFSKPISGSSTMQQAMIVVMKIGAK